MRELDWWEERECAGIVSSIWIYQFIGNLAPKLLRESDLLARTGPPTTDGRSCVRSPARSGRSTTGARADRRDLGRTRLIVVDSRCGRVLDDDRRSMLDEREWDWLERHLEGDFDHLLIGTSDPLVLAPALHYAERWGEAIATGAWAGRWPGWAKKLRRAADFDHWAAIGDSFERLTGLLARPGRGATGPPPRRSPRFGRRPSRLPRGAGVQALERLVRSNIWQVVCSPLPQRPRPARAKADRVRRLARTDGRPPHPGAARRRPAGAGPVAPRRGPVLRQPGRVPDAIDGRAIELRLERTVGDPEQDHRELHTSFERSLA